MAKIGKVQEVAVNDLVPYEKNAKIHGADQIEKLKASIKEFGFLTPCLIDKDRNIIAGHGRVMAAKALGMETVPCVFIEGLSEVQRRAYILADNKLADLAAWNRQAMYEELVDLSDMEFDVSVAGFDLEDIGTFLIDREETEEETLERQKREFEEKMAAGELSEDDEEYQEFLQKFEAKRTTDDCYTPANIYEAVAKWVSKEYGVKVSDFVRPFYPGGDYQKENYDGKIVVDNPPFSILSEIETWYIEHGVKFFLFAPSVSTFPSKKKCCAVCVGVGVEYDNGANVSTSFVTNLDTAVARTAPDLYMAVCEANKDNTRGRQFPNYAYPDNLVTPSMLSYLSKYGQELRFEDADTSERVSALDAQKEKGKGIYGGGYLLSEKAAAEKAAAEKAAAEKAAAEKAAAIVWTLSDREKQIIKALGAGGDTK